ncbi:cation:proton antiporter [Qaidamihabitans albus]|uniref:cation:proton antiporter n=1 Tax=Qaidamihabitans albus TaxID=2795733 RepID=UPI0018F1F77D|nr:cation:proton antiporter [Qaidamihabitans albus]
MALALAFGIVLLISISLSGLAARTVLSTALLFLLAGALLGQGGAGLVDISLGTVSRLADIALFTVLFTDGQRVSVQALREGWRLSGRALGLGMPLILVGVAVPAHFLAGLDWPTALLLGAILAPTDPVFASIIVGRDDIPLRLRRLLNVESGLNDGLALPFVLIFIATAAHESAHPGQVAFELALGLVFGIAVPLLVTFAWRLRVFTAEPRLQPLGPFAIAVLLYAACHLTHANPYLAAFVAGSTIATVDRTAAKHFHPFGDLLSEVTKFAALLVFGALITPDRITDLSWGAWAVAVLAIFLVRPAAILLSMLRSRLSKRERAAAAWFGPKGFASVVYGLHALQSDIPGGEQVFDLVAITIALSIVLHSSTDVPFAKLLRIRPPDNLPGGVNEDAERTEQIGDPDEEERLEGPRSG